MTDIRTLDAPSSTVSGPAAFGALGLDDALVAALGAMGFERPTPIQEQAVPVALEGRDVLASAQTGSGKTAAFLLPILHRILGKPRGTTRALVLTPTRELAAQIVEHLEALADGTGIRGAAVFGGVAAGPQEKAFRRGVDVLVATPGRLLDHLREDYARLDGLEVLVLDEADRMLDMGFLPDVRRVLRHLPAGPRQTLLFSATMPAPIVTLAGELLDDPATVRVERKQAPAKGITQALFPVHAERKVALLVELLRRGELGNVIAFCRTKHRANRLAQKLEEHGVSVARIHGNRSQAQRTDALAGFKEGRYQVLAATDIVARGIDVEALDHVVNFDVPAAPEDYIHRVGRTARAEATGEAYTFMAPAEEKDVRAIEKALGKRIERRTLDGFDAHTPDGGEPFEIPIGERIAAIRARKAEERARGKAKAERRAEAERARAANGGGNGGRGAQGGRTGGRGAKGGANGAGPKDGARGSRAGGRNGTGAAKAGRDDGSAAKEGRGNKRGGRRRGRRGGRGRGQG